MDSCFRRNDGLECEYILFYQPAKTTISKSHTKIRYGSKPRTTPLPRTEMVLGDIEDIHFGNFVGICLF